MNNKKYVSVPDETSVELINAGLLSGMSKREIIEEYEHLGFTWGYMKRICREYEIQSKRHKFHPLAECVDTEKLTVHENARNILDKCCSDYGYSGHYPEGYVDFPEDGLSKTIESYVFRKIGLSTTLRKTFKDPSRTDGYYLYAGVVEGNVTYIGCGKYDRWQHLCNGRSACFHANEAFFNNKTLEVLLLAYCDDKKPVEDFETLLISNIKPPWNKDKVLRVPTKELAVSSEFCTKLEGFDKFSDMVRHQHTV